MALFVCGMSLLGQNVLGPLIGHTSAVNSLAISPDGQRILSGSNDSTIRIWNAISGAEVLPPLHGHNGRVFSVAFSPDGTHISSGSRDKTVRVWDATSGFMIFTLH